MLIEQNAMFRNEQNTKPNKHKLNKHGKIICQIGFLLVYWSITAQEKQIKTFLTTDLKKDI